VACRSAHVGEALRDSRIRLDGPSWLVRAFPNWNARSMIALVKPVPGAVTFGSRSSLFTEPTSTAPGTGASSLEQITGTHCAGADTDGS